ncbi:hypothetical protein B296_00001901 [Ensete ventricosum]|uniref:Uncharacterized protein n=1 Tax=Ensete ventricosum TaxID=4639 RepID=A0A426ZTZ4_ENSVE|nr:hypothetical protein B296_00001901 [Ensete ventricosum]
MFRLGVTQEWVDEGELPGEQTKNQRWRRPYDVLAKATHGEVIVRVHHIRIFRVTGELDYFSAYIRLREPGKSEDKANTMVLQRWDFRGVIDPLLSWRKSIGRKRGRGGRECKGKLQIPRQGGRAEAKKFHKTDVNGLLIKIVESEGLRVDAGVLDQGTK